MADKLNKSKGVDRDLIWQKSEDLVDTQTKSEYWECNHILITRAISTLMQENGRMPSKVELSIKSGLSRQTIHNHLNEYSTHPLYIEQVEQFRFMREKILATVLRLAVNGDVKAARRFLDCTKYSDSSEKANQTINNYIQINQIKITQDSIAKLIPAQLGQIKEILLLVVEKND